LLPLRVAIPPIRRNRELNLLRKSNRKILPTQTRSEVLDRHLQELTMWGARVSVGLSCLEISGADRDSVNRRSEMRSAQVTVYEKPT
jgi:hypothetical protein